MSKKVVNKKRKLTPLAIRLIAIVVIFFAIMGFLQSGFVGKGINKGITFVFGYFYIVIYLFIIYCAVYCLFEAKLPKLYGLTAFGFYLTLLGLCIVLGYFNSTEIGMKAISEYMQVSTCTYTYGGFIGALLFGIISYFFEAAGGLIGGIFVTIIGLFILGTKFYYNYGKDMAKKEEKKEKEEPKRIEMKEEPKKAKEKVKKEVKKESKESKVKTYDISNAKPITGNKEGVFFTEDSFDDHEEENYTFLKQENEKTVVNNKVENQKYSDYKLPPLSLLKTKSTRNDKENKAIASDQAGKLEAVLRQFGVNTSVENVIIGPSITKYELKLESGIRVNKILQLQDDIKLAMACADIRIEAPVPGKSFIGIEIPNSTPSLVAFKDVYVDAFKDEKISANKLSVILGKDVAGNPVVCELDKMPHLLIAGATGSGKSVCINTIITTLLMRTHPDEVKLILVDPKKVELSIYNGIPHLAAPVVSDPKKAAKVLREVVSEMERRYDLFAGCNARNINSYNEHARLRNKDGEEMEILPYQVVILDEVADLMMVASKEVEDCVMRIAQMARAAGIHLIVATQRPSTDIITGVIKANIPSRIAFAVSSGVDSRTILDCSGAEKLLGKGDMLYSPMGSNSPIRVQGAYVSDEEVSEIVHYVTQQKEANYEDKYVNVEVSEHEEIEEDEEYEECREFVIQNQKASTSLLQRRFKIGYNKAARIMDQLEANGVIGPQNGSKPRDVYIKPDEQ